MELILLYITNLLQDCNLIVFLVWNITDMWDHNTIRDRKSWGHSW